MKKLATIILMLAVTAWASAQTIYLCKDGEYTTAEISQGMEIDMTAGYDSITFTKPQLMPVVHIKYYSYAGDDISGEAKVYIPSYLEGVKAEIANEADVTITSTNTTEEIIYKVSGQVPNGSLTIIGQYKMTLMLENNGQITSERGAAIDIQCGKRVNLNIPSGGQFYLEDAKDGSQKACLFCKGHLEFSGGGKLIVKGNKGHAIATNEYMQMKRTSGTIDIRSAAKDAIHVGQYFQMNGGEVNITETTAGDGIQAEFTKDPTDEHNGEIIIKGGRLNITVAGEDAKALKADSDITISGGTFNINANGNGSRGIQTDGNMVVGHEDNVTNILVNATGSKCTLPDCAADPHNCMGIKVDGDLTVNAGTITVYNTGKKSKGIKVGGTYTNNGGTVNGKVEK